MKERLTGAIILVVLIVLLVPELLSGPKGQAAPGPANAAAPSSEEPPLRSYTMNLGDDARPRSAAVGNGGATTPQPNGVEQPAAPGTGGVQAGGGSTAGSSQAANSQDSGTLVAGPQGAGSQGSGTREVVPPLRAQANPAPTNPASAVHQPNAHQSAPPIVARTAPPTSSTSHSAAGHPTNSSGTASSSARSHPVASNAPQKSESGWAVQLGVFASRENAERLAVDVRSKGFKVSVSPVTSGSRKLYKVRVGPAPDRAAAQELQGRLKASGRPPGTVVGIP